MVAIYIDAQAIVDCIPDDCFCDCCCGESCPSCPSDVSICGSVSVTINSGLPDCIAALEGIPFSLSVTGFNSFGFSQDVTSLVPDCDPGYVFLSIDMSCSNIQNCAVWNVFISLCYGCDPAGCAGAPGYVGTADAIQTGATAGCPLAGSYSLVYPVDSSAITITIS